MYEPASNLYLRITDLEASFRKNKTFYKYIA